MTRAAIIILFAFVLWGSASVARAQDNPQVKQIVSFGVQRPTLRVTSVQLNSLSSDQPTGNFVQSLSLLKFTVTPVPNSDDGNVGDEPAPTSTEIPSDAFQEAVHRPSGPVIVTVTE